MGIYWFVASTLFLLLVAWRRHIGLMSPYGIFIAFQLLYNLVPWAASESAIVTIHSLLGDRPLISSQMSLAASANLAFGLAYFLFYKTVHFPPNTARKRSESRNFALSLIPLVIITLFLVHRFGWNSFGQTLSEGGAVGGLYGLTSYVKQLTVAAYLYHLYRYGLDKWAWLIFTANILIMVVDGARTTGFPIMILTLMIWQDQIGAQQKARVYLTLAFALLAAIGTRSLMVGGNSLADKIAIPVTVEGLMGSYPSLQSIYAIQHHGATELAYTYGGSYIVDPILWLAPQGGAPRADPSFFNSWVQSINGTLPDDFAPMGGFYFISEAVAAFSYSGPFVVAGGYALLLILLERNKRRWYAAYLPVTVTIGLLFTKTIFGNVFKLFALQITFMLFFFLAQRFKTIAAKIFKARPESPNEAVAL